MNIDDLQLQVNGDLQLTLKLVIAFVMFGIAIDTDLDDFNHHLKQPKPFWVGLIGQTLLFPAFSALLVYILTAYFPNLFPHSIYIGILLIAACPGGNISNFITHLYHGNTALSIGLSAASSLLAVFLLPLHFHFWSQCLGFSPAAVSVGGWDMVEIAIIGIVPTYIGFYCSQKLPNFTQKLRLPLNLLSRAGFGALLGGALWVNWGTFVLCIDQIWWIVPVHNSIALLIGWFWAKLNGLDRRNCRTLTTEIGIQNAGLGLVLSIQYLPQLGGAALFAAWWGIWQIISCGGLMWYWKFKDIWLQRRQSSPSV